MRIQLKYRDIGLLGLMVCSTVVLLACAPVATPIPTPRVITVAVTVVTTPTPPQVSVQATVPIVLVLTPTPTVPKVTVPVIVPPRAPTVPRITVMPTMSPPRITVRPTYPATMTPPQITVRPTMPPTPPKPLVQVTIIPIPTLPIAMAPEDCLPYNPKNLKIVNEGAAGWLLTDGSSRMLMLDNQSDAQKALALAQRHTAHCFIGRSNKRSNRGDYIVEYWNGDSGLKTQISSEDCIAYNRANLKIVNEGANGWLLTDGLSRMLMLDNQKDAQSALNLAKRYSYQCFIGRGNKRADRKDYIVEYWK